MKPVVYSFVAALWLAAAASGFPSRNNRIGVRVDPVRRRLGVAEHPMQRDTASSTSEDERRNSDNPLTETTRFSHVMLRTPHVEKTIRYWKEQGGYVLPTGTGKPRHEKPESPPASAFVAMGRSRRNSNQNDDDDDESAAGSEYASDDAKCFAMELASIDESDFELGNAISYLGVSMLLQFQTNLLGAIQGDKPRTQPTEPNGIDVRSVASAPGDFIARFALRSNDLEATLRFYVDVLGMECKAQDEQMICLRYPTEPFPGVPTTLVFDKFDEIQPGTCFDHIAFLTSSDVDAEHQRIQQAGYESFLKPTKMFGKTVAGVKDPNGYKVVLASET